MCGKHGTDVGRRGVRSRVLSAPTEIRRRMKESETLKRAFSVI
jgi:hypothetical protein